MTLYEAARDAAFDEARDEAVNVIAGYGGDLSGNARYALVNEVKAMKRRKEPKS